MSTPAPMPGSAPEPVPGPPIYRDELTDFLDEYLVAHAFHDVSMNGLQVVGKPSIQRLALGVSASLALFAAAAGWGADAILVHHGMFWRDEPRRVDEIVKGRLRALFDHDINLFAYHLPLDAHPEVGNNAQLLQRLGLQLESRNIGYWDGTPLGVVGRTPQPVALNEFVAGVNAALETTALTLAFGPSEVQRIGIVSGGAAGDLAEAIELKCDAYLTGEAKEPTPALCQEAHINHIAAGHYNTEKFGVIALGDLLRDRFGLEVRFFDIANRL